MTGKKLISNLKYYLTPSVNTTIYLSDRNAEKELPCVVLGYDSEEGSIQGIQGHYTVSGYARVEFQGYEDPSNLSADNISNQVVDALSNKTLLLSVMNKPAASSTTTDSRPLSGFGLNAILIRGITREDEGTSTCIVINFDAYCAACDFS